MSKRLTTEDFINRAKAIHGNKYNYSLVDYVNNKTKIEIICKKHGSFFQVANYHTQGQGCPKCAGNIRRTTEEFIEKAKLIHGDTYDYSLVDYRNSSIKIEIICKKHGSFFQIPSEHLTGYSCKKCQYDKNSINQTSNTEDFIIKAKTVHGDKYDYSLVNYIGCYNKIEISCKKHGSFFQRPSEHLFGCGCPNCQTSKGEQAVKNYLTLNNIEFIKQKRFKNCYYIKPLPFDFYLPQLNTCIEYNGIQHYQSIEAWGGEEVFELLKHKDAIKREFCYLNNIHIIEIRYTDNVEEVLNFHLIKS